MNQDINSSQRSFTSEQWVVSGLCIALLIAWTIQETLYKSPGQSFSPGWLTPAAALLALAGMILNFPGLKTLRQIFRMTGLLLMVWAANGLIFDFLKMTGTVGDPATGLPAHVYWPGAVVRMLAFAAAIFLARLALARTDSVNPPAKWYGYAAFLLALPYPVFRILWAFGATPGLAHPGAGGEGFEPLIIAIPWVMAAVLSLLLISPKRWKPRRFLLFSGWTATAIVASIGPAAFWSIIKVFLSGEQAQKGDIATWVFCLFYSSWFLWAIAAFAATRSYQLRS